MDQSFLTRAQRMLNGKEVKSLDHDVLRAAIEAQQAASATARMQASAGQAVPEHNEEPLVELLIGGPCWRDAASRQSGCFSRAAAGRARNGS